MKEAPVMVVEVNVLGRRFSCTVEDRRRRLPSLPGSAMVAQWRQRLHRHSGAAA